MFKLSKADLELLERLRGQYGDAPRWYGVLTHVGRERKTREKILKDFARNGIEEVLLPELHGGPLAETKSHNQPELLFTGHIFLHCRMHDDLYMQVCAYAEVMKILGRAYRIPSVIADEEMRIFKGVLETFPKPRLASPVNIGTLVQVTTGLMEGMRGKVIATSASHVKIQTEFSFLGKESGIVVSVPREQVALIERAGLSLQRHVSMIN